MSGVLWQNINIEGVKKEFCYCDGLVRFSASSTLKIYPIVVLEGGNTEWVSCALGKENMAGAHCNHCNRPKRDFHIGCGELWTLFLGSVSHESSLEEWSTFHQYSHLKVKPSRLFLILVELSLRQTLKELCCLLDP